jgi:large subunit ribosomal protein L24
MNIKKDHNIIVISGKDKGKTGKVTKAFPKENKILVEGINLKKRHQRPRKQGQKGQIVEMSAPIDVSNVKLAEEAVTKSKKAKVAKVSKK